MRTEASLGEEYANNNNEVKSTGQHQLGLGTVYEPSMTFQHRHPHHQSSIKEERPELMNENPMQNVNVKVEEPNETIKTSQSVICAGCSVRITDRFYLKAVDKPWHSDCLRCDECRRPLDSALSCFARQSRIYCREDYYR